MGGPAGGLHVTYRIWQALPVTFEVHLRSDEGLPGHIIPLPIRIVGHPRLLLRHENVWGQNYR